MMIDGCDDDRWLDCSDVFLVVMTRLQATLGSMRGKIRISDAQALAGIGQPSNTADHAVGDVMRILGWERRRCRFDGRLLYGYTRGTRYEREVILDVKRGDGGFFVAPRLE
jgi:hypothetical protein